MIELGGNIKLEGFHDLEPAMLIVIKKIVGNYAKKINEQAYAFQELSLLLEKKQEQCLITAQLRAEQKQLRAEGVNTNLFFALDGALSKVLKDAKG